MKLAVLFHRLGPYHVARLRAAASYGKGELIAVELSGHGGEYEWDSVVADGFKRVTVTPEGDSNQLPSAELRRRIWATLDQVNPDVVAVAGWGDRGMRAATRWGRYHRRPMILMSDSQYHDEVRVWWKEWIKRRIVSNFATGFVAGTPHKQYLQRLGIPADRIFLGYDVVDNQHFANGADLARTDAKNLINQLKLPDKYFLTCARFVPKKNLSFLLEAYRIYRQSNENNIWDLVLVGDGELRPRLEAQAKQLGLTNSLHLPGFKQYNELPVYYGLASAFILPSIQDQWGLVVNEALATGLPVLVSEVCGCVPDLLGADAGFNPRDALGLAKRMEELTRIPINREENQARVANWGLERFAQGLWGSATMATT